ncbi:hypothetical protein IKF73_02670 [Candidatus Saccharibacteria bacterium]|nr:hypothetical protein [Candidatus Saccharibacteria bacterium]
MKKRGDTLVEVALAVGIFSMVAIAVVAVMVSSTSSAQTALETTLSREEIDTQAEALRFIHAEYLADPTSESPYTKLWQDITKINYENHAVDHAIAPNVFDAYLSDYPPKTCQEVMESETFQKYGFVINPRALSTDPSKAYIRYANNKSKFTTASTYPRLIYSSTTPPDDATSDDSLIGSTDTTLYRAEGIYVIAVADAGTKDVVAGEENGYGRILFGFYDFYIRTCWYGASSDAPSAISTVIRLYNPPDVNNNS